MKTSYLLLIFTLLLSNNCFAQSSSDLENSIKQFLSTLTAEELSSATFEFQDSLRTKWTNLPVGLADRRGINYGKLLEASKISFHDVLTTVFSSQGYLKTNSIMHLDDYLLEIYEIAYENKQIEKEVLEELSTFKWSHGSYFISIWGKPGTDRKWALKFEGHHISLNITSVNGELSMTPLFLGSDPALVRVTQFAGVRPLSKEEDYGLELFNMLSDDQKTKAIISDEFPEDIITAPGQPQRLTEYQGIKGSELDKLQKQQLEYLILEYISNFEREKAAFYMHMLTERGLDEIYFGWIGGSKRETNHYYVIHSPDFLIEYDNAGWIYQGDHIHTIFRDKKNDFGEDILKRHYIQNKHK